MRTTAIRIRFPEVHALHRSRAALVILCLILPIALAAQTSQTAPAAQAASALANPAQLQALSGEYTNPEEPDTPLSFYVQNGKLTVESERGVPTALTPSSALQFAVPESKNTFTFTLDATGRGAQVVHSN